MKPLSTLAAVLLLLLSLACYGAAQPPSPGSAATMLPPTAAAPVAAPGPVAVPAAVAGPPGSAPCGFGNCCMAPGEDEHEFDAHFVVGAGVYLLHPYFGGNPAFRTAVTSVAPGGSPTNVAAGVTDFDYGLEPAPLVWLGYVTDSGLGVRGRWWHFDHGTDVSVTNADTSGSTVVSSASPQGVSFSSPGPLLKNGLGADVMQFSSRLEMDVWDVEATQEWGCGGWTFLLSAGGRYVHLAQDYKAFRINQDLTFSRPNGPQDSTALVSGHNFNGAGPTASFEARRPVFWRGLVVYGSARGSLLFGSGRDHAFLDREASGPPPFPNTSTFKEVTGSQDDVLPILEVEMGAEYGVDVGRFHPFLRTGLVGQTWFGAGNSSGTGGNLGLLGLSATAGLRF